MTLNCYHAFPHQLLGTFELHPFALAKNNDLMEVYLVYLVQIERYTNATIEITNILDYFWHGYTTDVSLLYEVAKHQMVLYTYYPFFDEQHCKQIVVKNINSFNVTWKHSLATNSYPAKLHNLNNCSLVVAIWDTPPYLTYRPQKNGFDRVTDFEGILLIEFAKKLNFSLDYIVPPNDEQRGKRFSNGSTNGAIKLLKERKADMSLGSFRYTLERCEELTGALPYYQSWTVYAVLLMQPYSSLEILGFAFDTKTWLCLFISLCFTLILTYILHRYIKKSWLARIILGIPQPQTPLTNLVSVFLGVPITPMPSSTYTRFVIIHWFIYGLLIRTAYQSLLFQLLQTDMYQEPPKTLSDLISRHYTLIITTTAFDQVKRVPHIDETDIIFNNSTFEPDTFAIVAENNNKRLAGVSPMDFLKFYVVKNNKRGIFFCYPLNKSVNVQQSSWTLLDFEVQDLGLNFKTVYI
ncbi:uncharacterized protein LOC119667546 [Teleopsis dalmanni]|uniref:uncharacterized protein LOC119667546 n=1 Tax=Teleopsis dalmanni TaxID=139649 RepID=UPI0018CD7A40|nr:uncharacterized protein LOC119667546 [Teleopsis dalmanni]